VSHAYHTITQDDVAASEAARDQALERAAAPVETLTE
jgi:hypothetical protein